MAKSNINMVIRSFDLQPINHDSENRTIDFCASTGAKVLRNRWFDEPVYEELDISINSVVLNRLNNGAPFLTDHNLIPVRDQIGVIEKGWVENKKLYVRARFSKRANVDDLYNDVIDKIIRNVSIGYLINSFERYLEEGDQYETLKATSFTPYEVSLVTVPVDGDAGIRSINDDDEYIPECIIEERKKMSFKLKTTRAMSAEPETTITTENVVPENKNTTIENKEMGEQERFLAIMDLCSKRSLDTNQTQKIIKETKTFEEARVRISDLIHENFEKNNKNMRHVPASSTGHDEYTNMRAGIENAIKHRIGAEDLNENGRRFRSMSLIEICKELIPGCRDLGKSEIAKRALSTSDLPSLMLNSANKRLRKAYEAIPQTFRPLVRKASLSDFKPTTVVQIGIAPELKKIPEHGKYEETKFSDANELYQLDTFGRILSITRQMIINDDLNALNVIPTSFGRAASNLETKVVYEQLYNPKILMSDKKSLFHVDHKNLAVQKSKISKESLEAAENAIISQVGLENEFINLRPKYLIVPNALKNTAKIAMTEVAAVKQEDINVYANSFEIIVEPLLDTISKTAWYLVADPNFTDLIEIGYLNGEESVILSQEKQFESDVIKFKATLDFAAKSVDWRGFYKNEGV